MDTCSKDKPYLEASIVGSVWRFRFRKFELSSAKPEMTAMEISLKEDSVALTTSPTLNN